MSNVQICLHPLEVTSKAMATEMVGKITNEIAKNPVQMSFPEFLEAMDRGCTWAGGTFDPPVKKAKNWTSQQVFAIDVDNNDGRNYPVNELANHYRHLGFPPNGWYFSLSSTEEQQKYRLIWVVEEPIIEPEIAKNFKRWLIKNSDNCADSCTINLDRLFFGGKNSHLISCDFIPNDIVPQVKKLTKKRKKEERWDKGVLRGGDLVEFVTMKKIVRAHFRDPSKKYITRYKTIFNCAVMMYKYSQGTWGPDEIFDYFSTLMESTPKIWANYHYTMDEVYNWIERACDWADDEVMVPDGNDEKG